MDTQETSAKTPPQSTIEPEAAEKFASAFVPLWQFDDAPFSASKTISAEQREELDVVRSPGASPSPRVAAADPPADAPASSMAAVSLADSSDSQTFHLPPPRRGLLIGVGAFVAAIVTVLGIAFARPRAPVSPAPLVVATPPARVVEEVRIPPPPSDDTALAPAAAAEEPVVPPQSPAQAAPPPAPAAPLPHRATTAPAHSHTQEPARPSRSVAPPSKSAAKTGGGLVRDNPF